MAKNRKLLPATPKASKASKLPVTSVAPVAPATDTAPAPARVSSNVTRTVATVTAGRTNFNGLSDRDGCYLAFYKILCAANGGTLTVAQIAASGQRPAYSGSNKPHDAGAIVRLTKAGLIVGTGAESDPITITDAGKKRVG